MGEFGELFGRPHTHKKYPATNIGVKSSGSRHSCKKQLVCGGGEVGRGCIRAGEVDAEGAPDADGASEAVTNNSHLGPTTR